MIKAIIFDCFGVLTTDGWRTYRERYFMTDAELSTQALTLDRKFNSGDLPYDKFITAIASMAGKSPLFARQEIERHVANNHLLDYIATQLKPRYKVGMLSNAGENWLKSLFSEEQIALFDQILLSYQIGVVKPDAKMYTTIAERLDVRLEECLFTDDRQDYCDAAARLGMRTIHFKSTEQFIQAIDKELAK